MNLINTPKPDPTVKQTCQKIPTPFRASKASSAGSQASVCYELTQIYLSNTTDEISRDLHVTGFFGLSYINYWIKSLKKVDTLWLLRFFRIKNTCWSKIARVHHPFWDGWTWIFIDLQKGKLGGSRSHSRLSPYFHFQFPPNLPCSIYYWRSRDPDDVHHEEHQQDSPYQRSHRIGHRHHLSSRSSWHDLFFRSSSETWKKMDNQHDVTQSCNVRWTQKNEEPLLSQPTVVKKYHAKMQCESRPTQSSPPLGTIVRSSFTNCKIRTKRMIRSNLPTHSARGSNQRVRKCAYTTTKQIKIKLQATKRLGKTVNPLRHVQSCLIILRFFSWRKTKHSERE